MERTLEIACRGSTSRFMTRKLTRSTLYGRRRRVPVDAQGRECRAVALTRDGVFLLPPGSTATLYLDEDGDVVERDELRPAGAEQDAAPTCEPQPVEPAELLGYTVRQVYALEPVAVLASLEALLPTRVSAALPIAMRPTEDASWSRTMLATSCSWASTPVSSSSARTSLTSRSPTPTSRGMTSTSACCRERARCPDGYVCAMAAGGMPVSEWPRPSEAIGRVFRRRTAGRSKGSGSSRRRCRGRMTRSALGAATTPNSPSCWSRKTRRWISRQRAEGLARRTACSSTLRVRCSTLPVR